MEKFRETIYFRFTEILREFKRNIWNFTEMSSPLLRKMFKKMFCIILPKIYGCFSCSTKKFRLKFEAKLVKFCENYENMRFIASSILKFP